MTNGNGVRPTPPSLELRKSIYQTTMKGSRPVNPTEAGALASQAALQGPQSVTYACDTCGVDCTKARYHSLKVKDFELCPNCYLDGRFPSKMFSGDFIKITASDAFKHSNGLIDGEDDWTDEEKLLLLEGIEMYDDDWYAISEHVRTRSKEQCVAQFLQMPIEDPYVNPPAEGDLGPLAYSRIPFDQTDNPVMSVVAFLASAVSPGVAAAAAQSAIGELTDGLRKRTKKTGDDKPADVASAEATTAEPNMDVDGASATQKPPPAIPKNAVERAAGIALGSAAAKAQALADHETNQIRSLTTQIVKSTVKKLELKMKHFEMLEDILETERRNLEVARQSVLSERAGVKKAMEGVWELTTKLQQQEAMGAGLMGMGVGPVQAGMAELMQTAGMGNMQPSEIMQPPDGFVDGQGPFAVDDTGAMIAPLS